MNNILLLLQQYNLFIFSVGTIFTGIGLYHSFTTKPTAELPKQKSFVQTQIQSKKADTLNIYPKRNPTILDKILKRFLNSDH
ncbi:hypothetical protein HGA91_04330 [candidate division WWE3 bacterium]|nr:hypothetical protein [candidate division WWE3 bacterium]